MKEILLILVIIITIIALIVVITLIALETPKKKAKKQVDDFNIDKQIKKTDLPTYTIKEQYLSYTEKQFYNEIKRILNDKYIIFPQVPLSQIIIKNSNNRYQNELYRIIDFCIFDKNYHPLLCIEINDETHRQRDRYIRDKKVQDIINSSGLHLITFWTSYGINPDYIRRKINCYIKL